MSQTTTKFHRLFVAGCTLAALFFCALWLGNAVYAQENDAASRSLSPAAQQIVTDLNQIRTNAGLPPLTLHPLLNQAAQNQVDDMLANHFYGHMGSDGSFVRQRVQRVGYSAGGWASENWVAAQDPAAGMNWWMNDWIHRENILNNKWRELGVGAGVDPSGGMIFVTVFTAGQNPAGESVPASNPEPQTLTVPVEGIDYAVQAGDTLLAIALRYGLDWTMIAEANRVSAQSVLQIGQVLRLPGVQSVKGNGQSSAPAQTLGVEAAAKAQPSVPSGETYTVQAGDTLLAIALRFHLDWQEVASANGLGEAALLQIGRQLIIPNNGSSPPNNPTPAQPTTYTIAAGDTIISIALRFNMDWQTLLRRNSLSENSTLRIGQVIQLQ